LMRSMKNARSLLAIFILLVMGSFFYSSAVLADNGELYGLSNVEIQTELGDRDLKETAGALINVVLGFLGIVAIVLILVGGFKFMVAGGSDEKAKEATGYIMSGIVGLIIILSAYAITRFVLTSLMAATVE